MSVDLHSHFMNLAVLIKMSRGFSSGGSLRNPTRRKVAVSYVIRDVEEKLNRSGVNKLCLDPNHQQLYTAGRDSIIRSWDISQTVCDERVRNSSSKCYMQLCLTLEMLSTCLCSMTLYMLHAYIC